MCLVGLASIPSGAVKPDQRSFGVIAGRVTDSIGTPLVGASVLLAGPDHRTKTDDSGQFALRDLNPGRYTVRFSHVGYETKSVDNVIVAGDSTTHLRLVMTAVAVRGRDIIVEGDTRVPAPTPVVGAVNLTREELRRTAGFSEDVIRSVNSLPGISRTGDFLSAMSVRGGSPSENGFYVDGMPIPDINHLPMHGSAGGAVGLINNELIEEVGLSLGGFDAPYGGRLSSVMEITTRDGSHTGFHARFDASQAGLGAIVEGPVGRQGSIILSARHGMLDELLRHTDAGIGPQCNDYQGKLAINLSARHRLFAVGIAGADRFAISREEAREYGSSLYGRWRAYPYMIGAGWTATWNSRLATQTTLSSSATEFHYDTHPYSWRVANYNDNTRERSWTLRSIGDWHATASSHLKFGLEATHQVDDESYELPWYIDPLQHYIPAFDQDVRIEGSSLSVFATHSREFWGMVSTSAGVRAEYSSITKHFHLAPRLSATWCPTTATSVQFASGVVYQTLPSAILSQKAAHRSLADPTAYHLVLTVSRALDRRSMVGLSIYSKWYEHMPIDRAEPQLYVFDEVLNSDAFWFQQHTHLAATGQAISQGLELVVRGRTQRHLDGMLGGSLSSNRYRDGRGDWHARALDTRYSTIVEGGWNIVGGLRVSVRWFNSGGAVYSPIDVRRSSQLRVGIIDSTKINTSRLPSYHSINLRVDQQISIAGTRLGAYLTVWNLLDRKTVNSLGWYEAGNAPGQSRWLGRVIFGGLEYRL